MPGNVEKVFWNSLTILDKSTPTTQQWTKQQWTTQQLTTQQWTTQQCHLSLLLCYMLRFVSLP